MKIIASARLAVLCASAAVMIAAPAAAQTIDVNKLIGAGAQVAQMVDQNHSSEVWDQLSAAIKQKVSRAQFVTALAAARQPLGKATARAWLDASVARIAPAKAAPPPGAYFTVEFQTTFSSGKTAIEKISFRNDEDNVWRPSGYSLR